MGRGGGEAGRPRHTAPLPLRLTPLMNYMGFRPLTQQVRCRGTTPEVHLQQRHPPPPGKHVHNAITCNSKIYVGICIAAQIDNGPNSTAENKKKQIDLIGRSMGDMESQRKESHK